MGLSRYYNPGTRPVSIAEGRMVCAWPCDKEAGASGMRGCRFKSSGTKLHQRYILSFGVFDIEFRGVFRLKIYFSLLFWPGLLTRG